MAEEAKTAEAMRDLEAARKAYKTRDVDASKAAHASKLIGAEEKHKSSGDWIKNVVYGGLDGIITTFAVVAGASGGGLGIDVIVILGFSNIFADGLSMGMGDALSSKAEADYIRAERARETWEYEENMAGEIEEMVDLYTNKGMSREDATSVIQTMAKYKDFFIDIMMVEELELQVPSDDDNPWKDGAVTFLSFIVFGLIPLLGYVIFSAASLSADQLFIVAICLTCITLFILGAIKSRVTNQKWYWSGMEILIMGSFTAATAYVIGWAVEALLVAENGAVNCGG